MSGEDEDDKPTVVLDLNALKKQKLKQEEDLANIASELEFNIPNEAEGQDTDSEDFAEQFLDQRSKAAPAAKKDNLAVILFDFGNDFFKKSKSQFPKGFDYQVINKLTDLNQCLKSKNFQIVVFNYDGNPKAVNQLCAQIKAKKPTTKTIIMAKAISPEKAKAHAKTASGANGYYQFPLDSEKIEKEFQKVQNLFKKVS
jgi:carbamoylphosphate synthase small subunit